MFKILMPAIVFLILLLLFPSICVEGAGSGLRLWLNTMVPTLFPFLVVTNLLREYKGIPLFERVFSPFLSRLFRIQPGGAYPVILGYLCGYPMGAKAVADCICAKRINRREAGYLLTFTNNPSPAYMSGYVCLYILDSKASRLPLLVITFLVPVITALFSRHFIFPRKKSGPASRMLSSSQASGRHFLSDPSLKAMSISESEHGNDLSGTSKASWDRCLTQACEVLVKVGGFMMLFSVISALVCRIPGLPPMAACIISGLLEQTTGLALLKEQSFSPKIKTVLAMVFVCFGGLSIAAQTYSVIHDQGLSLKSYFWGKILSGIIAALLTLGWIYIVAFLH